MGILGQPGTLPQDFQSLDPGALVELYILDATNIPGGQVYRFHCGTNGLRQQVVWQGNTYQAYPIKIEGFSFTTQGTLPRPKAVVANPNGLISSIVRSYNDLRGAKVTRKQVFAKHLDAVNFPGGSNPTANPNAGFEDEVYYVERKETEDNEVVVFELACSSDMEGTEIPARFIQGNICPWIYRSSECSYTGGACAQWNDTPTANINLDVCGKRISSCKLRFPNTVLPFGGFPGAGRIK